MLKDLIKETCSEIIIDFDAPLPVVYVSDEDLECALCGIDIIKEITSNYERLCNL